MTLSITLSLTLIPSSTLGAPACALVPQLRDVTINQGLGSYPKLVQGKETLVRAYLSLPSCAASTSLIRIVGGALTVRGGNLVNTAQAPFPAQLTPFPLISPNYKTTPPVDSPGDPKWVVPGSYLDPTGTAAFTATFSMVVSYQTSTNSGATWGNTLTVPFTKFPGTTNDITKAVERETNPLRVLVVPVGNAALPYASQYSAAANEQVQLAMQTISRIFPVADGTGELNATTGGVRFSVLPTLIDVSNVLDANGFCLRGSNFDVPIKGQLQTLAQQWETENPGIQIDVAVAVIDPAISLGGSCAQGMAVQGSSYTSAAGLAVARMTPNVGGATLAMEISHALGLVPSGRGRAGDPSHSPVTAADAGSNRGYNVRDRSFLADDRTALYNSGTGFTNTSTLVEQLDYQFLLCALGGSSTADCANPGLIGNNVPSSTRFVMSGTVAAGGASVRNIVVAYSSDVPGTPPANSGPYTLRQLNIPTSGPPQVLRTDFVRVSFAGTHHEDSDHAAGEHKDGVVDVAVPFNPDADRVEFRNGTTVLKTFNASAVPELTSFQVTHTGDGNYTQSAIDDASPTVSPDGAWVAWTEDPGGEDLSRIMVGPIEDSEDAVEMSGINAVLDGESQYEPAWRSDGGALGFISDGDLYTIDVDISGSDPTFSNLTFVVGYDDIDDAGLYTGHPTWSPDGTEIAFDADGAIFKITADGELGDEVQLTFTGDASHPSWSQTDGDDRIAYERQAPSEITLGPTSILASYVDPDRPDPPAVADISDTNGDAFHIAVAPASVQPGASESDSSVIAFDEGQVHLREPLSIDAAADGVYDELADLVGGTIATDTIVKSHLLHFDPVTGATLSGTVFFEDPIIGVIASPERLDNSDYRVGTVRSTAFVAGMGDRGPDLDGTDDDQFTINGVTLDFALREGPGIDEIRVITSCGVVCVEVGDGPPQVVTTNDGDATDDDGVCDADCTLAEAIGAANASPDRTLITFDIGTAPPHTISPTADLPALGTGTVIDGDMIIQLSGGAGATTGLTVSGSSTIREMVINQFDVGVSLFGGSSRLEGNYIGTDPTGLIDLGNTTYGVAISTASTGNVIGGLEAEERNVISGNGDGAASANVLVGGSIGNYIINNLIGTDASGTVALTNGGEGVHAGFASGTIVGGSDPLAGNVIGGAIVGVESAAGSGTIVLGNSIGVAFDSGPLGNVNSGVLVNNSPDARVGGTMGGASNIIGNSGYAGVQVAQDGSGGTLVSYNGITGNSTGVIVGGASNVTVGDADGFFGNDISSNTLNGVDVIGAEGVRVLTNSIHDNGGLGIDLDGDGVTDNDSPTAVANQGQNTPVLTSVVAAGDTITVDGTLDSLADTLYRLDIYANAACDAALSGEGEGWLGSTESSTDGSGHLDWSFDGDATIAAGFGDVITMTATDPLGNTSEFSVCDAVVAIDLIVNTIDGNALDDDGVCDATHCTLAEAIDDANANPGADTIGFSIPGSGPHNIALTDALPAITDAVAIDGTTEPDYISSPVVTIDGFDAAGANGLEVAASGVTIRGLAIADFDGAGIVVNGANVVIESNVIGGSEDGNGGPGVLLEVGDHIAVGGIAEGAGNEISWNGGDGVEVTEGADFNPIRGNSIHDNDGLGIDLGPIDDVTANDEFDNDSGGNDEMNFPRILSATFDGVDTLVSGDLDGESALASPTIDLYEISGCDVSGNGEGESYLGSFTITPGLDGDGHGDWSITLPGDMDGAQLTATTTDVSPQTSEFSVCFTVETDPETFTVNTTDDHDLPGGCTVSDCALREAINRANATPGLDTITFDIPGTAPYVIQVSSESPLPIITDAVVINGLSEPDWTLGGPPVIELDGSVAQDGVNGLVLQADGSTIRGLSILGFPADGIHVTGNDNTIVANQIGGNAGSGIFVEGASGTLVEGNGIGTNANGTLDIGNGGDGITVVEGVVDGIIGGTAPESPNRIKFNGGDGIGIDDSSSGVLIRVNLIDENGGLGIDLSQDNEVRFNDLGDGDDPDTDTGANGLQNYPSLDVSSDGTLISGTLISTPDTDFEVDIFVSPACDGSDNGEGASFAGSVSVTTNQFGYTDFDLAPDGPVGPAEVATATATGPEGTSEFSVCQSPALDSDEVWTLDPSDPIGTQERLVEDAVDPSWGTAGQIAFARDSDIYTIGSDGLGETQLTDLGLDSSPSLGGAPAFVRFVDDVSGTQYDVFLLLDEFNVTVTANDDHPADLRLDLIYACPGSPNYDVAVGLVPTAVTATSASWARNFDASLACPNGTLRPVLTDFWNRVVPTGQGTSRQITSLPQPPVAAIYVPEVGDTLLQWNALALHGSGKDADDGELLGASLRWFINGVEVNYAACGATHSHCDIQPPAGSWMPVTGPDSIPLTVRLQATDSDGDTHSDEVTIQVLRDADEDGIPKTVETPCSLSDTNPRDAFSDLDSDLYFAQDDYALGGSPCVAATSYPAIVKFSPSTLYIPSSGSAVTMSVELPLRDIKTVSASSVKLQLLSGAVVAIPNIGWKIDSKGVATASFNRQTVIQKLQQLGMTNTMVYYTIVGTSSQGWSFEGTDIQQAKPAN